MRTRWSSLCLLLAPVHAQETVRPDTPFHVSVFADRADLLEGALLAELLHQPHYAAAVREALPEAARPQNVICGLVLGTTLRIDQQGTVCRFTLCFELWQPGAALTATDLRKAQSAVCATLTKDLERVHAGAERARLTGQVERCDAQLQHYSGERDDLAQRLVGMADAGARQQVLFGELNRLEQRLRDLVVEQHTEAAMHQYHLAELPQARKQYEEERNKVLPGAQMLPAERALNQVADAVRETAAHLQRCTVQRELVEKQRAEVAAQLKEATAMAMEAARLQRELQRADVEEERMRADLHEARSRLHRLQAVRVELWR